MHACVPVRIDEIPPLRSCGSCRQRPSLCCKRFEAGQCRMSWRQGLPFTPSIAFLRCQIHPIRLVPQTYQMQKSRGTSSITSSGDPVDMQAEKPQHSHALAGSDNFAFSAVFERHFYCAAGVMSLPLGSPQQKAQRLCWRSTQRKQSRPQCRHTSWRADKPWALLTLRQADSVMLRRTSGMHAQER